MTIVATNLDLDPELLDRAFALSGEKTKKAAVTKALEEFVARHDRRGLLDLFGALEWDPAWDPADHPDEGESDWMQAARERERRRASR